MLCITTQVQLSTTSSRTSGSRRGRRSSLPRVYLFARTQVVDVRKELLARGITPGKWSLRSALEKQLEYLVNKARAARRRGIL